MFLPLLFLGALGLTAAAASGCEGAPHISQDGGTDDGSRIDLVPGRDAAADGATADGATTDAAAAPWYSFVVLPDTQYYSSNWPDIFAAQTRWIVENRDTQRIAFVLHVGDIVDTDIAAQWAPASQSLHALDGEVPYVVTAGNHDYFNFADRMGLINSFLPPSHFETFPWFGGTFEPGHSENSFSTFGAGGAKWLVIALEFGPRDEVLAWANQVVRLFRGTPVIIVTHAYLYRDGTRYDQARVPKQQYNPHDYVMMGQAGQGVNDGEEMWRKLIEPNSNIRFVFSGHDVDIQGDLPPGTAARLTSTRGDGTRVHQVLANYQSCTAPCLNNLIGTTVHGGNGFLRILRVSPAERSISVTTYSPYLDRYLSDPSNQFTLDLN